MPVTKKDKASDQADAEIREETQNLMQFIQLLLDAGMSVDSALNYGFEWAGNVSLGTDKYDRAALELKAAADALKISRQYQNERKADI